MVSCTEIICFVNGIMEWFLALRHLMCFVYLYVYYMQSNLHPHGPTLSFIFSQNRTMGWAGIWDYWVSTAE